MDLISFMHDRGKYWACSRGFLFPVQDSLYVGYLEFCAALWKVTSTILIVVHQILVQNGKGHQSSHAP